MRWVIDEDGDIGITFWNILTLIKYKHSITTRYFVKLPDAPRYVSLHD